MRYLPFKTRKATAAHLGRRIQPDDHLTLRSIQMQIVVLCIFVEGSGDVNCVVGIYNDIADLIAGGNFSCMQIAVAAAGNGDGNCLIGQQDFTGSGVSGIIDLNLHFAPEGYPAAKGCRWCRT